MVVDTGGIASDTDRIGDLISQQAVHAIHECDIALLLVDAREGLTPEDQHIAKIIRTTGKAMLLAANKIDGINPDLALGELHRLGFGEPIPIAAAHARGLKSLSEAILEALPEFEPDEGDDDDGTRPTKVAIVGRPNVGKSTLINKLVGAERVVAHDMPGTTRDSVFIPFERGRKLYTLIDTAGVRRRARVHETIEKFSVIKTLQAIEAANVVVLMVDSQGTLAEQDLKLLGHILDAGRALVIALNKWDLTDRESRSQIERECERRLRFVDYANVKAVSAITGSGVGQLMREVDSAWTAATTKFPTPELTRILGNAVEQHPPPIVRGRRIKLRYAHQGGSNPPRIIIHGTQTDAVPASYQRYLMRVFREVYSLTGTPVKLEFRSGDNPYEGKKNSLTKRQVDKRRRMMKHVKRR